MSTDRDVERIVRSWMDEGVTALPDRVLDAVLDQLPATPQQRARWPAWRLPAMNYNFVRFGLVVAAVVVIAFLGIRFLVPGVSTGGPGATPTPVPTATPTLGATPVTLNSTGLSVPLSGGRYAFEVGARDVGRHFAVELTMEAGWVPQELALGQVTFAGPKANGAFLGFYSIGRVYRDPCHPEFGYAGGYLASSTFGDLVNELGALAGFDRSPLSTVHIGDLTATHFVISNTIDTEWAGCTDGQLLPLFVTWEADRSAELETRTTQSPATSGGTSQEVWIVDGGLFGPLVLIGKVGGTSPDEDQAALEEIVRSITLVNDGEG